MRFVLIIVCLFASSFVFAQNIVTGKWKPVFLTLDKMITADVKAGTTILSDTVDVILKDDKDPEASKKLIQFMAEMMLEKMKNAEHEFLASGEYIETDKKRNNSKKGTYTYDAATNSLTIKLGNRADKFMVSFKNGHLVLTGELENGKGKKGEMKVEYEKL